MNPHVSKVIEMERPSKVRKNIGPKALISAIGVMIAFSVAGIVNPVIYYTPDKVAQASMANTPGSRKIFTTYFYWYHSGGSTIGNGNCAENWTADPYPAKVPTDPSKYPAGWPGPTNPADMVKNINGTLWHDAYSYHPPAEAPKYNPAGSVIGNSLKNGTINNITTWFNSTGIPWHEWELRCMMRAGIDVLMPVDWWNGLRVMNPWAIDGLQVLVQAWYDLGTKLVAEGQATNITNAYHEMPKICMFYDTTCMKQLWAYNMSKNWTLTGNQGYNWYMDNGTGPNLNEAYWQEKFWNNIDAFLQCMDDNCSFYWNGRYIVWLYSAGWFSDVGTTVLQYCRDQCMQKHHHLIYFVGGDDWSKAGVDGVCGWGSSFGAHYPAPTGSIPAGAVGPGYYNLGAIKGQSPLYKVRDPGRYFHEWQGLIDAGAAFVHVETWNELFEGTGIAWSQEYGFEWIDLTGQMADMFHSMNGYNPYTQLNLVTIIATLGALIAMVSIVGIATRLRRI